MARHNFIAALALAIGCGLALGLPRLSQAEPALTGQAPTPVVPAREALPTATFADIAEAVMPAVINVNAMIQDRIEPGSPLWGPTEEEEDFGDLLEPRPSRSLGSGVVLDPRGIAVTNAHVIGKATRIEAVTLDGRRYKAKLVGLDTKTDLAVIRVEDAKVGFAYARLGDSDGTRVGDWVIAVGSPYGLRESVTAGIVSAKARHLGQSPFDDFLQTDAATNPGSSGGPLVNLHGEVIGINTAIVASGSGIGFAIPSNVVKKTYAELLAKGRVSRAWLGVSTQPLTPELASAFHARQPRGMLVSDVSPGSPAAGAGLRPGDILVEFDGTALETTGDFLRLLGRGAPGQLASLKVWRDRREHTVEVRLGQEPEERETPAREIARRLLGLQVRPITPDMGVVVARVERGGPAYDAGLRRGDVVREINRQPVRTMADFERATQRLKAGDEVTLLLQRGSVALYVLVPAVAG